MEDQIPSHAQGRRDDVIDEQMSDRRLRYAPTRPGLDAAAPGRQEEVDKAWEAEPDRVCGPVDRDRRRRRRPRAVVGIAPQRDEELGLVAVSPGPLGELGELGELEELEMTYQTLDVVEYDVGRQFYGTLTGSISGDRLAGDLNVTNLAVGRPDEVNTPTIRGTLKTRDGAAIWVEIDGIATLRETDDARVFVTSVRFRTGSERYLWSNTVLAVLESVLNTQDLVARGRLWECRPTAT